MEIHLEEMERVDGVSVTKASTPSGHSYRVTFDGPSFSNGDQSQMVIVPNSRAVCQGFGSNAAVNVFTETEGLSAALPEVVAIRSTAASVMSGSFDLSFDFFGD